MKIVNKTRLDKMKHHNPGRETSRPVPPSKKGVNRSPSKRGRFHVRRHQNDISPEKHNKSKLSRSLSQSDAELVEEDEAPKNENIRHAIHVRK